MSVGLVQILILELSIWSFLKQWEDFTRRGRAISLDLASL